MDPTKPMGCALAFKDPFHRHPGTIMAWVQVRLLSDVYFAGSRCTCGRGLSVAFGAGFLCLVTVDIRDGIFVQERFHSVHSLWDVE